MKKLRIAKKIATLAINENNDFCSKRLTAKAAKTAWGRIIARINEGMENELRPSHCGQPKFRAGRHYRICCNDSSYIFSVSREG